MRTNNRALIAVACFAAIAAAAVVIVRHQGRNSSDPLVEVIPPNGILTTEVVADALQLHIDARGLTLVFPNCDVSKYQDKFFLHIYTVSKRVRALSDMVNLDFYLAQEKAKESTTNGIRSCVYHKNFSDFRPKEVSLGQFTMPNGRCCNVTWSRTFDFSENSLIGRP